jgi:hypothetical protein
MGSNLGIALRIFFWTTNNGATNNNKAKNNSRVTNNNGAMEKPDN